MNVVFLSGGSGKRLWPLSNESNSKQFLKLLRDGSGGKESMVQRVYRQLRAAVPDAKVVVSTGEPHVALVRHQLGDDVQTAVEPSRRDTFPAVVLSAAFLKFRLGQTDDDIMTLMPIDVCAEEGYFHALTRMPDELRSSGNNLVLMGVIPTYNSMKYGYIKLGGGKVTGFKEKPTSAEEAGELIGEGSLWNAGVFCMTIGYALEKAKKYIDFKNYDDVLEQYGKLPRISADYEISEHEPSISYVEYDGKWKDLGTWNTLTEEMSGAVHGDNVIMSSNCENVSVVNTLNTPVMVLGVKNAVVVASYDGILVSDKIESAQIKPYADGLTQRAMFERRSWGEYKVLDYDRGEFGSSLTKRMKVEAGKSISYQLHNSRNEIWVVVEGAGTVTIEDKEIPVSVGSTVTIPVGRKHKVTAHTNLEFIEVQFGTGALEEIDIQRL
ncbi:MAG: cupin domain-containing protein [Oscillospiraceae bacterium]|jgi:mannose-1-phosphate guanylyltransferase|nr:cupin domain-containing protein [Oscillospiraceae bacterium]